MAEPITPQRQEDDLDRLIREQLQDPEFRAAYQKARETPTAIFETLIAENRRLRRERDLAVAHDRQPYPTADAYERVCESNRKHRERADKAEAALARERQRIDAALSKHIEAPSAHGDTCSYCAHDGFTWPCATVRALIADWQQDGDTP